ncbi:MAG: serine/threonine-protein kinase [Planctomycetia bacterium]|nr:serine/threonine-protein kinase [Planctomycetia bacterium]
MGVKKFGPFVLERMIGRGGMGAVYRAHDENSNQTVAVKALLLPLERERERFEAEISTLRRLRHENIVKLFGFGQEDGILYYAMEFVDGPSLSTLLRKGRRFTWEETVYIGLKICNALKHAHDRGVIHRDIKPANILLVDNGVVKVSDYGIAQYFGAARLTNANQVVGTIEFMAPEQAQASSVTPKTDIYSLGALMYALLTGKPPYQAKSLPELLKRFRESFPESVRVSRPETPKIVDDVVFELLQIQPEKRPGDARLIARRLEAILCTLSTYPDGNPFSNQRFESCDFSRATASGLARAILENAKENEDEDDDADTTMCKDSPDDFKTDPNEDLELPQDFPYRPIGDEIDENFDFESPFDKPTEHAFAADGAESGGEEALDSGAESVALPEEDGDFVLDTDDLRQQRVYSECETSTGEEFVKAKRLAARRAKENALLEEEIGNAETKPQTKVEGSIFDAAFAKQDEVATLVQSAASDGEEDTNAVDAHVEVVAKSKGEGEDAKSTRAPLASAEDEDEIATRLQDASAPEESDFAMGDETTARRGPEMQTVAADLRNPSKRALDPRLAVTSASTVIEPVVYEPGNEELLDARNKKKGNRPRERNRNQEPQLAQVRVPSRNVPFEELGERGEDLNPTPLEKFKKSVFTPVKEEELDVQTDSDEGAETNLFVRFRVVPLALMLGAIVFLVVGALKTPSADKLYGKIDDAFNRSSAKRFNAALRDAEKNMRRFSDLYPNDPRAEKVNYFLEELKIQDLDQRLERQALNPGREPRLQPIVRAYLDARRVAGEDWETGSSRLAAFIDLFGSDHILAELEDENALETILHDASDAEESTEETPRSLRELVVRNRWKEWKEKKFTAASLPDKLVVIAKRRYLLLEEENRTTHRADAALLNDRLITAQTIAAEAPERAESIRRAAQTLYGEKDWARTLLNKPDLTDDEPTQASSPEPETPPETAPEHDAPPSDASHAPEGVPETPDAEPGTETNEIAPESVPAETIPQESENEE